MTVTPAGKIRFARKAGLLCIRLEGRITFALGPAFADFIEQVFKHDSWDELAVDVTATTAIDSTGLGLIAKIARLVRQRRNATLTVLSTNEKITQALLAVGLDRLLMIVTDADPSAATLAELPVPEATKTVRTRAVLDAHRELIGLSEKNAAEFRSVVEFLEQELRG